MPTDLTGHHLDHYALLERLGGNMGDVYRAWDTSLEREAAVKVLAEERVSSADDQARFRREAQRAAQVGAHPNVVTIYGAGEAGGWPYIAMEFLRGEDLAQLLEREGPLPPERAMRLLEQAASALDHLHAQSPPIVHRDVKPANFMVLPGDRVILTDFGLARHQNDTRLTQTGAVIGSPSYMAPEQVAGAAGGQAIGKAADIYSLGAMAYEMLCGRPPFVSDHLGAVLTAHLAAPVPSVRQWRAELPRSLDALFGRALAKEPKGRPGSAGDLVGELSRVVRGHAAKVPTPARRRSGGRDSGEHRVAAPLFSAAGSRADRSPWWRQPWGIATATLAGVTLLLATALRVDKAGSNAEGGLKATEQALSVAVSGLASAQAAGNPTFVAIAQQTKAAAGVAVAGAKATLDAIRGDATASASARQTTSTPGGATQSTTGAPAAGGGITLIQPVDRSEHHACTVRFVWRFDVPMDVNGQSSVDVRVCRDRDSDSPKCDNIAANSDKRTAEFAPQRFGRYTWQVLVGGGVRVSGTRTFQWDGRDCGAPAPTPLSMRIPTVEQPAPANPPASDRNEPSDGRPQPPKSTEKPQPPPEPTDGQVEATPGPNLPATAEPRATDASPFQPTSAPTDEPPPRSTSMPVPLSPLEEWAPLLSPYRPRTSTSADAAPPDSTHTDPSPPPCPPT